MPSEMGSQIFATVFWKWEGVMTRSQLMMDRSLSWSLIEETKVFSYFITKSSRWLRNNILWNRQARKSKRLFSPIKAEKKKEDDTFCSKRDNWGLPCLQVFPCVILVRKNDIGDKLIWNMPNMESLYCPCYIYLFLGLMALVST